VENGRVRCESAATPWTGKEIVLAVRITGGRGRPSAWSNLVTMKIIPAPTPPRDVRADNTREGVRLLWGGSGPSYRVFRRAGNEPGLTPVGNTEARELVDRATEYGKEYHYLVQAIAKTGTGEVESDLSIEAIITPRDTFPPAIPAGLSAVPATNSIELGWERATDPDLAGYRVYRALPGGDFEKIAETPETPSYSDRQIESGKQYRYAVSAFDKSGNESNRSDPIEVTAP
jgi:fibronectin type 3 domain-containing protein